MSTTLFGWGPTFDLPAPSPFVMKCDIQLQMLGVSFDRALADLESVSKHKAPYVDDDGRVVEDSTFIRLYFEEKLGRDLDAGLSAEQRAIGWAIERMLEDRLVHIVVHERWMEDANFDKGPRQFFAAVPEAMREQVIDQTRSGVKLGLHSQGIGRHSRRERMQLAARDIQSVASVLGDKPFLFGDAPTATDASAYGVIVSCSTRFFESELPRLVERHPALVKYLGRMADRFGMHAPQRAGAFAPRQPAR